MKLRSDHLLANLSADQINRLTFETTETLVKGYQVARKRKFSTAELWNIHRLRNNTFGKRLY